MPSARPNSQAEIKTASTRNKATAPRITTSSTTLRSSRHICCFLQSHNQNCDQCIRNTVSRYEVAHRLPRSFCLIPFHRNKILPLFNPEDEIGSEASAYCT